MKTKNLKKKLYLKKVTISDLHKDEMSFLHAGYADIVPEETHKVNGFGDEICPNGTTRVDSHCPVYTCGCLPE